MADESTQIRGEILNVMETFPLQLDLQWEGKRIHVMLKEGTKVKHRMAEVGASILKPNSYIAVQGTLRGTSGIDADAIELLKPAPDEIAPDVAAAKEAPEKKELNLPEGTILGAPPMESEITISPRKPDKK